MNVLATNALSCRSGEYLTLLPLSKGSTMSWLDTSGSGVVKLVLGNFGTGAESGTVPLLAWAKDRDLYRSLHKAWEVAIGELEGSTDWRMNKVYPDAFKYLGWCSWEHFRKKIDSDKLVQAAKGLGNGFWQFDLPVVEGGMEITLSR